MALFNNFPYTDLNDINLDYTLQKLESLYTRGEQLYSTLTTWQQATDAELEQWKAATESSLALWKTQTENSIDNKIQLLTAAINTAFTDLRTQLEAHIAEIETTAVNAASAASDSATAAAGAASAASINNEQSKEWAIGETLEGDPVPDTNPAYENNAKYYADLLGQETEQIDTNTADITDLKSAISFDLSEITVDKGTLVANEYIDKNNGDFLEYSGWSRTGYIPCNQYAQMKTNVNLSYSAFYNDEYEFVKTANFVANTYLDVPTGAKYVAISGETSNMTAFVLNAELMGLGYMLDKNVDDLVTDISNCASKKDFDDIDYRQKTEYNSSFIDANGAISSSASYKRRRYFIAGINSIKIIPGRVLNTIGYAVYDKNLTRILNGVYSTDSITLDLTNYASYYIDVTIPLGYTETQVITNFAPTIPYITDMELNITQLKDDSALVVNSNLIYGVPASVEDNRILYVSDGVVTLTGSNSYKIFIYDMTNVTGKCVINTALAGTACNSFVVNGQYTGAIYNGTYDIPAGATSLVVTLLKTSSMTAPTVKANFIDQLAYNRRNIYGKSLGVMGDSIVAGNGYSGGWAKIIGAKYHMDVINVAQSGGTIQNVDGHAYIPSQLTSDLTSCDYVLFDGGINDWSTPNLNMGTLSGNYANSPAYDTTTFIGALEKFCYDIRSLLTTSKIGYVFNHRIYFDANTNNGTTYKEFVEQTKACLRKWGIDYVDIADSAPALGIMATYKDLYTLHNDTFPAGDGWHPNKAGYDMYYVDRIAEFMISL